MAEQNLNTGCLAPECSSSIITLHCLPSQGQGWIYAPPLPEALPQMIKLLRMTGCPASTAWRPLCSGCRCTAQLNRKPELPERMEAPGMLAPWPEFVVHSHQPLQLLPCRGGQQFMLLHTPWASAAVWSPG